MKKSWSLPKRRRRSYGNIPRRRLLIMDILISVWTIYCCLKTWILLLLMIIRTADNYCKMLYNYDYFRSVKNDGRFWVMETSTSHNGCLIDHQKPHRTGFLTAEAVAAYAAGGMGFNYWLWRQQKSGCEQPHGSLMSAWGSPLSVLMK